MKDNIWLIQIPKGLYEMTFGNELFCPKLNIGMDIHALPQLEIEHNARVGSVLVYKMRML
jgi:hypothetical protein